MHKQLLTITVLMLAIGHSESQAVEPFVFAHLTDTHVADSASCADLRLVLADLHRHKPAPEFIVVTGDLSDFGTVATLTRYHEIMTKSGFVFYSLLGNHDTRWSGMSRAAQETLLGAAQPFSFVYKGVQFIGLNSGLPLEAYGHIDPQQVEWLERELDLVPEDRPRIFCCHHPLFFPDRNYQPEYRSLMTAFESVPVSLFLCGHGHSLQSWTTNSIRYRMGAATVRQQSYQLIHVADEQIRIDAWIAGHNKPQQSEVIPLLPKRISPFVVDSVRLASSTDGLHFVLTLPVDVDFGSATWRLRRNQRDWVNVFFDANSSSIRDTLSCWLPGFNSATLRADFPDGNGNQQQHEFLLQSPDLKPLWQIDLHDRVQASLFHKDALIVACAEGKIIALQPESGEVIWSQKVQGEIRKGMTCVGDRCYVATTSGMVACLSRADGLVLWRSTVEGSVNAPPDYKSGFLYVADGGGKIYKLDGTTGVQEWVFQTGDHIQAKPYATDSALFVGSWDRYFYAIDVNTGSQIWRRFVNESKYFAPATAYPIGFNGLIVFVAAAPSEGAASVYACDPADGAVNWTYPLSAHYCPPKVWRDRLLFGAVSGIFYALDDEGELLWQIDTGEPLFDAAPAIVGDQAFLCTLFGTVWRIDLLSGHAVQRWQMGDGFIFASPDAGAQILWAADLNGRVMAVSWAEPPAE